MQEFHSPALGREYKCIHNCTALLEKVNVPRAPHAAATSYTVLQTLAWSRSTHQSLKLLQHGVKHRTNQISLELSSTHALCKRKRRRGLKETDTGFSLSTLRPRLLILHPCLSGCKTAEANPVCAQWSQGRKSPWCGSSTGKHPLSALPVLCSWPWLCAHFPLARCRYLLCEVVSDDPRCRLSMDDRALCSLVRDTIARVHGTFGAAACSLGFAGARVLGNRADRAGEGKRGALERLGAGGGRKGTSDPRSCQACCTILSVRCCPL